MVPVKPRRARKVTPQGGFTLIELSVAGFLSTIVLSAVVLIFNSVSQNAADAGRRGDLQVQAREVVTELTSELRSAVAPRQGATAIESLDASTVVFYSDRYDFEGPERFVYERTACNDGYCQLRVRRYAATPGTGPNWTHSTTAFNDTILLEQVVQANALFSGRDWTGTPRQRVTVTSCGGATKCGFPIVAVDLRAAVPGVTTIDGPFALFTEVNLRNA